MVSGPRYIRPTRESSPNSRESSPDTDIYGPTKYDDPHQMQRDMIDMQSTTSPTNYPQNVSEYQNSRPYQTSWTSGDFHPSAYPQSDTQSEYMSPYVTSTDGTQYLEDVEQYGSSDHYGPARPTPQYYRSSHTALSYRQQYQNPRDGGSRSFPYENVVGYQVQSDSSSDDQMQEDERFELEAIDWKPLFKVEAHAVFLETLERLWTDLCKLDPVNSPKPADPAKTISNFLEGSPVIVGDMCTVLALLRAKGASLAMITNDAGYDICDVIIQSPDLFVQSLLPFLIHCGYNVYNRQIPRKRTHLHLAWQCDNKFAFYTLLKAGADPNELYGLQKQTLLHHMLQMLYSVIELSDMDELHVEYIGVLLNQGANVAIKNANEMTCADYCDYRILRLLRTKLRELSQPRKQVLEILRRHLRNNAPENVCSFLPRACNTKPPNTDVAPQVSKSTLRLLKIVCYNNTSAYESDQELGL